uniref:Nucleotide-binding oligomerization domain-containing protein 1-like n=1 Tax=Callorhinchus milii TaxID=7868 RepID=A0A4W3KAD1_CALMI
YKLNSLSSTPRHKSPSYLDLLRSHRVELVNGIKNTECLLDNLLQAGHFTLEDTEVIQQTATQHGKVQNRKILDIISGKGEETAEYFIYIMYRAKDVYSNLEPWLEEIHYCPSDFLLKKSVLITDAGERSYTEKLRHELGRDSKFISSYAQKQDTLFEDTYTETLMELINNVNEPKGMVSCLDELFSVFGVISEEAETVIVTGDAGVGKSILLQKLQSLWSKGELCADVKFFFKFRCRIFNSFKEEDKISLKDLLFKYNCYPDRDVDEIFRYICQHAESVLFTLDGFDEINIDCDVNDIPDISSPFVPTHPVALLMNLLRGKLLKGSKKVLTARTGTILPLRIVRKKVVLKGFSKDNLLQYLKKFFKNKSYQSSVLTQLEANPHLCTLCSVPLFCWIIFKSYEHILNMPNTHQLSDYITLTDVYLLMVEVFLNHSCKMNLNWKTARSQLDVFRTKRSALMHLGKLARNGIENSNFLFHQEQITAAEISEQDLQLGFIKAADHYDGLRNQSTYEFLHLTLQSFFAALSLAVDDQISSRSLFKLFNDSDVTGSITKKLRTIFLNVPKPHSEHIRFTKLFLCGLLSSSNINLLMKLACPTVIQGKRSVLTSYLNDCVKSHIRRLPRLNLEDGCKIHILPCFVWLIRFIFEMQNEAVAKLAARGICNIYMKLTYCNICSSDCSALTFILLHIPNTIALEMDNNNINDYGVEQLLPSFSKLTVLRLSVNQITDHGACVLAEELRKYHQIKSLGLYKNHLSDVGARAIAQLVESCPSLVFLRLGSNMITHEGGAYLAKAIQNSKTIEDVGLWGNQIGDRGAEAFAEALRDQHSLKNLRFRPAGNRTQASCLQGSGALITELQDSFPGANDSHHGTGLVRLQPDSLRANLLLKIVSYMRSFAHKNMLYSKFCEAL